MKEGLFYELNVSAENFSIWIHFVSLRLHGDLKIFQFEDVVLGQFSMFEVHLL